MSTAVPSVMSTVLEEAAKYIVKKVVEGKGLSDREVVILILDQVNKWIELGFNDIDKRFKDIDKRFIDLKEYIDKRLENINRRIDDLNAAIKM